MTQVQTAEWLTTQAMAERLGIHKQTLLEIRRKSATFKRTRDWRNTGLSTRGPLQWHALMETPSSKGQDNFDFDLERCRFEGRIADSKNRANQEWMTKAQRLLKEMEELLDE
mgnify:CR=1 FL=1